MKKGGFEWSTETVIILVLAAIFMGLLTYIILNGGLNLVK